MRISFRGMMIAIIALFLISAKQTFADVRLGGGDANILYITNMISKNDADYIIQHEANFKNKAITVVWLDSSGGDVDAALKIGRIFRDREFQVVVAENSKCFSSCALIYIAGVTRFNHGIIGLHRPYLASAPRTANRR